MKIDETPLNHYFIEHLKPLLVLLSFPCPSGSSASSRAVSGHLEALHKFNSPPRELLAGCATSKLFCLLALHFGGLCGQFFW
jgi:hypothetical protein